MTSISELSCVIIFRATGAPVSTCDSHVRLQLLLEFQAIIIESAAKGRLRAAHLSFTGALQAARVTAVRRRPSKPVGRQRGVITRIRVPFGLV
jgi:hypothetical protein